MLLLLTLAGAAASSLAAQDITQEEIERARVVRQHLSETGLLVTDVPLIEQNVDIGSSRLLDFAKYTRNSVELADIGGSDANTRGLEFHPDGTRLYVVTRTNRLVSQYDLRRPWDIGSARFSGDFKLDDLDGGEQAKETFAAHGIFIRKSDGKKMWIFNRIEIWEFDLETPWDIESASVNKHRVFKGEDGVVRGHDFDFSSDGKNLFIDDRGAAMVHHFTLSNAWDVDSATRSNKSMAFPSAIPHDQEIRGIQLSNSGDRMFLMDPEYGSLHEFYLSKNFDLGSAKLIGTFDLGKQSGAPYGMVFSEDLTRFYIADNDDNRDKIVYQYKISVVDAEESLISSNLKKVVADGKATARISVTAKDRDGDTISGVRVRLSADNSNVTIQNVRNTTNSSGVATFDVSHDKAGEVEFRASGMGIEIEDRVSVGFATVDQNNSLIAVNRKKVLANGSARATVTVTARDKDGDPIGGVDFKLNSRGHTDVEIDNSNSKTDSDGKATFLVTSRSYGTTEFIAEGLGVKLEGVSVRFVDVDPEESEVVAESRKVLANNSAEGIITVIARDEDGDELEGAPVRLRSDSDHPNIENSTIVTNSDGVARFKVRSGQSEAVNFYAEATGNRLYQEAEIRFVTVDPEHSVIAIEPEEIEADGEQSTTLTVTTRDEDGDILSGARVEIEALNGSSTISDRSQVTDEEGVASFTVTNGRPEIVRYKVIAEGNLLSDNSEVRFIPVAPVALSASSVETRTFTANWELVNGAEYYLVDVATDSTFSEMLPEYSAYHTGDRTTAEMSGVSPVLTEMYRVRAVSDGLIGANSGTIATTTYPDTPVVSEATDRNALKFRANWNAAEGAESYRVDLARDANFESLVSGYENTDAGSATHYTFTDLEPDTRYFYRVRSVAGPRTSGSSEVAEVTTLAISRDQSVMETEQLRVLANGQQANTVYITVKSEEGILLEDLLVDFTQPEGTAQIDPVQERTNENGVAIFNVTSTVSGPVVFHVSVAGTELGDVAFEFLPDSGVLELGNNYPNPFLIETTLPVTVPYPMHINLQVYNAIGAPVRTVVDERYDTGYYEFTFDGNGLAAGVYFFRLTADGEVMSRKMVLIK